MSRTCTLWGLCLLMLSAGCTPEARDQTQVTIVVESDLTLQAQLGFVKVELLGRNAPDPQWFRVTEGCANEAGKQVVGSFSLTKKVSNKVRVRVTGHGPELGDGAPALVSRTVDVTFREHTKYAVSIALNAACMDTEECPQEESCDPASAACAPIAGPPVTQEPGTTLPGCIRAVVVGPALAAPVTPALDAESVTSEDGGAPDANPCVDGDGYCDPVCSFRVDSDCLREQGDACSSNGQCKGELCAQGVCCDRACSGTCERCDLDGQRGTCTAVDFALSSDVAHCGGCGLACSDNNIDESCLAGVCAGICSTGYADCNADKRKDGCEIHLTSNEAHCGACGRACSPTNALPSCIEGKCVNSCRAGYADCNADDANDGCERNIRTDPLHCDGCNKRCLYPYCHEGICAERAGRAAMSSVVRLSANTYYAFYVPVYSGAVVALGGLFAVPPGAGAAPPPRVRFALYEAGSSAAPISYVTETLETQVLDADLSKPPVQRVTTHAPVLIPRVIDGDSRYFLVVLADRDVDMYAETSTTNVYRSDPGQPFTQATSLPPLRAEPAAVLDGFVFLASDE